MSDEGLTFDLIWAYFEGGEEDWRYGYGEEVVEEMGGRLGVEWTVVSEVFFFFFHFFFLFLFNLGFIKISNDGYSVHVGGKFFTLFSAVNYRDCGNNGAIMVVNSDLSQEFLVFHSFIYFVLFRFISCLFFYLISSFCFVFFQIMPYVQNVKR